MVFLYKTFFAREVAWQERVDWRYRRQFSGTPLVHFGAGGGSVTPWYNYSGCWNFDQCTPLLVEPKYPPYRCILPGATSFLSLRSFVSFSLFSSCLFLHALPKWRDAHEEFFLTECKQNFSTFIQHLLQRGLHGKHYLSNQFFTHAFSQQVNSTFFTGLNKRLYVSKFFTFTAPCRLNKNFKNPLFARLFTWIQKIWTEKITALKFLYSFSGKKHRCRVGTQNKESPKAHGAHKEAD